MYVEILHCLRNVVKKCLENGNKIADFFCTLAVDGKKKYLAKHNVMALEHLPYPLDL
jgi:hypothetical protein